MQSAASADVYALMLLVVFRLWWVRLWNCLREWSVHEHGGVFQLLLQPSVGPGWHAPPLRQPQHLWRCVSIRPSFRIPLTLSQFNENTSFKCQMFFFFSEIISHVIWCLCFLFLRVLPERTCGYLLDAPRGRQHVFESPPGWQNNVRGVLLPVRRGLEWTVRTLSQGRLQWGDRNTNTLFYI